MKRPELAKHGELVQCVHAATIEAKPHYGRVGKTYRVEYSNTLLGYYKLSELELSDDPISSGQVTASRFIKV